ncbi:LamG domain-containing protein [Vibrio sp. B1ASS3]|uniref:LamG domain-containing protein n=2 Tax=Vibrio sp. B1ASS3 TaxID=2751176 RepID=UPI001BC865B0|nr:LamG domain-containing protein [Vibrio sp. B1ASS3]
MNLDLSQFTSPVFIQAVARDKYGNKVISEVEQLYPLDSDKDQAPDHIEQATCSDPYNADSDGDGLSDGLEMGIETGQQLSSPCSPDSDGDGIDDGFEYEKGWDLQGFDIGELNDQSISHWAEYAQAQAILADANGEAVVSGEHVLDVTDKEAFGYTGLIPSGDQSMTFMYWVKFKTLDSRYQLSGVNDGDDHRLYVGLDHGRPTFGAGSDWDTELDKVEVDQWLHLAVVFDKASHERIFYLNGREISRETYVEFQWDSLRSLLVGAMNRLEGASDFQDARLNDVQVWSRALDGSDIQGYMVVPPRAGEGDLMAYYDFSRYRGLWVENVATGTFDMKLSELKLMAPAEVETDHDGDGLSDTFELSTCSDPYNADSDGDGLSDGLEMGIETGQHLSDPCSPDSDGDGIDDGFEYEKGWDLQGFDIGDLNDQSISHWAEYAQAQAILADANGEAVVSGEHVLDVTDKEAFGYTGFMPSGDQSMTFMYWVKFKTLDSRYQLSGVNDGDDHRLYVGLDHGRPTFGAGSDWDTELDKVEVDQWLHLAVVFDKASHERIFYLNGREISRETYVEFQWDSLRSLLVGAMNRLEGASDFQDARLNDVQVWSRALDGSDIQGYMVVPPRAGEGDLMAYYDFSRYRGLWVENVATGTFDMKLSELKLMAPAEVETDHDGDGLSDTFELSTCSDPYNADSDGDGLSDGLEMGIETGQHLSDPCSPDSDGDGIDDGFEYEKGWDLQGFDIGDLNDQSISHWAEYAQAQAILADANGEAVVSGEHVLDVTDKEAFGYTGFMPSGDQSMTFMYWVKFKTLDSRYQLSGVNDGDDHRLYVGLDHGRPTSGAGSDRDTESDKVEVDQWLHLAVVFDKASRERIFYLNGREISRDNWVEFQGDSLRSLLVGAMNRLEGASDFQDALLDDVQVWSRALDGSDMQGYMGVPPRAGESDLMAYYNFSRYRGLWVENVATGKFDMKLSDTDIIKTKTDEK